MKKTLNEIKTYAINNNVPIIMDEGLEFIINEIKKRNIKKVLEIGTAIGYSAISFAMEGCFVVSIERDLSMYNEAINNISRMELNNKIQVIHADALTYEINDEKFDLIFIDAAKAQYEKFFNKYSKNLNNNGIIICDNLNFHNLDINKVSRSTKALIKKINNFKTFLINNQHYKTNFYNVGDGMSVSEKI